jgi:hypothetical protein
MTSGQGGLHMCLKSIGWLLFTAFLVLWFALVG